MDVSHSDDATQTTHFTEYDQTVAKSESNALFDQVMNKVSQHAHREKHDESELRQRVDSDSSDQDPSDKQTS